LLVSEYAPNGALITTLMLEVSLRLRDQN